MPAVPPKAVLVAKAVATNKTLKGATSRVEQI